MGLQINLTPQVYYSFPHHLFIIIFVIFKTPEIKSFKVNSDAKDIRNIAVIAILLTTERPLHC